MKPVIGITMGDVCGVGPEIVARSWIVPPAMVGQLGAGVISAVVGGGGGG